MPTTPHSLQILDDGPSAWLVAIVLALAIGAIYCRVLDVPLLFDDDATIRKNQSIESLWPPFGTAERPGPLRPPAPLPTAGRPLVNLTFALNYAVGGVSPMGYHAANVLIHFGSAMLLFAIIQRTLRLPCFAGRFDEPAGWLALAVSMLWALHPLQTEAVIYATQRTELLFAFFYLATLYCSMRYWSSPQAMRSRRATWLALAGLACLSGMASKEVMVSAPLMVLLYERAFLAGSLKNALRQSWPLYVVLSASWLFLLLLNLGAPRGDTAGFGVGPALVSWWLTQAQVLVTYFKLVVWPSPLLIHYDIPYLETLSQAWPYVVPVSIAGAATLVLLWRNRPSGFLGAWVFAILAPTSIVPIITEMAAERRMYLPLAAVIVFVVIGGFLLVQMIEGRRDVPLDKPPVDSAPLRVSFVSALLLVALGLGLTSASRVNAYYDVDHLWRDVIDAQPKNPRAHYNLGESLERQGRLAEAIVELQAAANLSPDKTAVFSELGLALANAGRLPEAIEALRTALRLDPNDPVALNNMGFALIKAGKNSEAIEYLHRAIQLQPTFGDAYNNLGIAFGNQGDLAQSIKQFQQVLGHNNKNAKAHSNLGLAFYQLGDQSRAIEELEAGLQLDPNDFNARYNLATILAGSGRTAESIGHYEKVIQKMPQFADAQSGLGDALRRTGRLKEAIQHYQATLQIKPDFVEAYTNLAQALATLGRSDDAIATAKKGIDAARAAHQPTTADQLDEWLKHYEIELHRAVESPPKEMRSRNATHSP